MLRLQRPVTGRLNWLIYRWPTRLRLAPGKGRFACEPPANHNGARSGIEWLVMQGWFWDVTENRRKQPSKA